MKWSSSERNSIQEFYKNDVDEDDKTKNIWSENSYDEQDEREKENIRSVTQHNRTQKRSPPMKFMAFTL